MSELPAPPDTTPTRAQAEKELEDWKGQRWAAERDDPASLRWIDPHIQRLEEMLTAGTYRHDDDKEDNDGT